MLVWLGWVFRLLDFGVTPIVLHTHPWKMTDTTWAVGHWEGLLGQLDFNWFSQRHLNSGNKRVASFSLSVLFLFRFIRTVCGLNQQFLKSQVCVHLFVCVLFFFFFYSSLPPDENPLHIPEKQNTNKTQSLEEMKSHLILLIDMFSKNRKQVLNGFNWLLGN